MTLNPAVCKASLAVNQQADLIKWHSPQEENSLSLSLSQTHLGPLTCDFEGQGLIFYQVIGDGQFCVGEKAHNLT